MNFSLFLRLVCTSGFKGNMFLAVGCLIHFLANLRLSMLLLDFRVVRFSEDSALT